MVFYASSINALSDALHLFRQVELERKVVVILEDSDEFINHSERDMLNLMDGDDTVTGVLYLASTNYINRFPQRLLRPGRFDNKIYVPQPTVEACTDYLYRKLKPKGVTEAECKDVATKLKGLSFGHLKEYVICVYAMKEPKDEVITRLQAETDLSAAESVGPRMERLHKLSESVETPIAESAGLFNDANPRVSRDAAMDKAHQWAKVTGKPHYVFANPNSKVGGHYASDTGLEAATHFEIHPDGALKGYAHGKQVMSGTHKLSEATDVSPDAMLNRASLRKSVETAKDSEEHGAAYEYHRAMAKNAKSVQSHVNHSNAMYAHQTAAFTNSGEATANAQAASKNAHNESVVEGVLYHGTKDKFTKFDLSKSELSPRGSSGALGFHFTANREEAGHYAGKDGRIISAHVEMKNPKHLTGGEWDKVTNSRADAKHVRNGLIAAGHDGAVTPLGEIVAFHPHQIKPVAEGNVTDLHKRLQAFRKQQDSLETKVYGVHPFKDAGHYAEADALKIHKREKSAQTHADTLNSSDEELNKNPRGYVVRTHTRKKEPTNANEAWHANAEQFKRDTTKTIDKDIQQGNLTVSQFNTYKVKPLAEGVRIADQFSVS